MDSHKLEKLRDARRGEKDTRVLARILAVLCVEHLGKTHAEAAELLMRCPGWVCDWVNRYREGGIDALRAPRPGRRRGCRARGCTRLSGGRRGGRPRRPR